MKPRIQWERIMKTEPTNLEQILTTILLLIREHTLPDVLSFGGGIVPSPGLVLHPDIIFTMSSGCSTCSAEQIFFLYQNKWLKSGFGWAEFGLAPFQKYIIIRKGTEAGGSYPTKLTLPDNVTYWGSTPWNGGPRPWP